MSKYGYGSAYALIEDGAYAMELGFGYSDAQLEGEQVRHSE